ncbi:hypothetical protein MAFF241647_20880 [Ralstonia solanacearum]|uniref:DUF4124 domain-containing protein n=4 Tax=Ralstonia solanacearum species complex TaxID=3116862 RepID=A0A0S4VA45_RALSL|nr:hypothetical protein F504_1287 [Ralstonia pseudosolanacearum FQY_4]ANH33408.1 signal peptide protein [Ralstonia solanacearum]ESS47549.1 hypothetical protein L665_03109 [Ralstonia solanacearum SD54]ARU23186.1 hypothetical protein RSSE_c2792 [Ralstonia solanacearum]CUV24264.1 conserved exported protein of unknown function [Ralstonia solanacearum]
MGDRRIPALNRRFSQVPFMFRPSSRIASGLLAATAALAALSVQVPAHADDVYLCTGPNGVPEYRNSGNVKGCRKLSLPDVVTVPGTRSPRSGGAAAPAESSGSFPRVDSATQKSRDSERRRVLEAELSEEERKLQALQAEYNNGQPERQGNERNYQKYLDRTAQLKSDIERSQANVESIRRELSNLKE